MAVLLKSTVSNEFAQFGSCPRSKLVTDKFTINLAGILNFSLLNSPFVLTARPLTVSVCVLKASLTALVIPFDTILLNAFVMPSTLKLDSVRFKPSGLEWFDVFD